MSKLTENRVSLYLQPDQMAWLREEHERTGAPIVEIMRRALDEYRQARNGQRPARAEEPAQNERRTLATPRRDDEKPIYLRPERDEETHR